MVLCCHFLLVGVQFRRDVEASLEKMVANVLRDVEEGTCGRSAKF